MKNDYEFLVFPKCSLYQWKKGYDEYSNTHTQRTSFVTPTSSLTISFWLLFSITMPFNSPPFWSFLINVLITQIERFYFGIISSNVPKTRASGLPVEETNVATVVTMNWRRDNFFLNAELLFLCHSGCSVSDEYTPPGIIIV